VTGSGTAVSAPLRPATRDDLPHICALLASAKLPTAGVAGQLPGFVVCDPGGEVAGVGGLEIHGSLALLRSLAVAPSRQRRGLATSICDRLEQAAARRGIRHVYLLTETAERFFARRGYAAIPRADAPAEIAASEEFSALCPQTAVLMRRAVG
jgi:amino-acid N-acetyltransferase